MFLIWYALHFADGVICSILLYIHDVEYIGNCQLYIHLSFKNSTGCGLEAVLFWLMFVALPIIVSMLIQSLFLTSHLLKKSYLNSVSSCSHFYSMGKSVVCAVTTNHATVDGGIWFCCLTYCCLYMVFLCRCSVFAEANAQIQWSESDFLPI